MARTPLALPPGVVRGASPAMAPGRFYDANLVRWVDGVLQPVGGWERITSSPLSTTPRRLLGWFDNTDIRRLVALCDEHIAIVDGSVVTYKQPVDFLGYTGQEALGYGVGAYGAGKYGTPRTTPAILPPIRAPHWSVDTWGQDILALASTDGRLLLWSPSSSGSLFAPVSGAPLTNRAMVVTPERHILLAGAGGDRRKLAWCSREDRTDWNIASTTNTAGELPTDCKGAHNSLYKVREGTLLFTDDEVWLVRYVGQPYIFGAERISETADFMSPRSIVTFDGKAVWMGRAGFWIYEGLAPQPLPCDLSAYIFEDINLDQAAISAHGGLNGSLNEITFFYPSAGSNACDRAVTWNYKDRWWAPHRIARSAWIDAQVYPTPIAASPEGHLYNHETGWLDAGLSRVGSVYAETGPLTIAGGDRNSRIAWAELDSGTAYDATRLQAYCRQTRQGPEAVKGPYAPRADGYTEMRFEGRDIRLRFEATRDELWSIGSMRMDVRPGAGR